MIKISQEVLDGLEGVSESGRTNMFDRNAVYLIAVEMGYYDFAGFALDNPKEYPNLVFGNFEVEG